MSSAGLSTARRFGGERLTLAVSVLLVLELAAGITTLVTVRRDAVVAATSHTVTWQPESQPLPYVAPVAAPPTPTRAEVVSVTDQQTQHSAPPAPPQTTAPQVPVSHGPLISTEGQQEPAAQPAAQPSPKPRANDEPRMHVASTETDSERIFREHFPAQAAARQIEGDRPSFSWAVLVGVNDYQGRTRDTIGSVADAKLLRELLLERGWRDDHILLLTDRRADHDGIVRAFEWLARSTDQRSTVVFSFSGHMRYQRGDPDRDGEEWDSGLWPHDNRYLWDKDVVRLVNAIPAKRMWLSFQGCHSGGVNDPGLEAPGRLITYSSLQRQKSYEDPEVGHSVQGWFMFAEGIRDRWGDVDGDGRISVQEAQRWGAPRARIRTAEKQDMQMADGYGQPFFLEIG